MKIPKIKLSKKKALFFLILLLLILVVFEATILFNHFTLSKATSAQLTSDRCKTQTTNSSKLSCWQDLIDEILATQGLGPAFEVLDNLFKTEPAFAAECHSFAHTLGQKAYELYADNKDVNVSPKSSYCGYGFYHGFMEELVHKTNDMNQARAFCEYAGKKLSPFIADAGGACYHGIGHGTVDGSDPRAWGNQQAMVEPALKLCEDVSNDENPPPQHGKLFRCVSGAFNALEILMDSSQYKLSPDKEDPFSICRTQPERYNQSLKISPDDKARESIYKEACYTQFVVSAMQAAERDYDKIASFINTISEDKYAIPSLQSAVVERVHTDSDNYQNTISYCRGLVKRFQIPCITAFGEGFLKYGPPEKEYVKAIDFCGSPFLTELEKVNCFDRVLSILRNFYTKEKSTQICKSIEPKYQISNCSY